MLFHKKILSVAVIVSTVAWYSSSAYSDCKADPNCFDKGSHGYCELIKNSHIIVSYDAPEGSPPLTPSMPEFSKGTMMGAPPNVVQAGDTFVYSFRNDVNNEGAQGSFDLVIGGRIGGRVASAKVSYDFKGLAKNGNLNKLTVKPFGGASNALYIVSPFERNDCKIVPRGIRRDIAQYLDNFDVEHIRGKTDSIMTAYEVPYDWECRLVIGLQGGGFAPPPESPLLNELEEE